jgi:sugar/nucleoside kinase (ribokinase family)
MISVAGHTAIDHIFRVPVLPNRHHSTFIVDHQVYYGGGAANIAAGIGRLGEACSLVSAVGDDFLGGDYERWLDTLSVSQQLHVVEGARTATAYLFNDDAGDQMTFFEWGASSAFAEMEAPALNFVHMATADPSFNVRVAEKSTFASFDPGQDLLRYSKEQLDSILSNIDILFANQHEVRGMCTILGVSTRDLIARVPCAVVTMSGEGSVLHSDGVRHRIPVVPVPLADPTGAGDAYRAGFLTAYVRGYDPKTACMIGAVTASFAVEKVGCQTNLPDWHQMRVRFEEHFGTLGEPGLSL